MKKIISSLAFLLFLSWNTTSEAQTVNEEIKGLVSIMKGEFSSAEQAKNDTDYYSINLVMYPIWEDNEEAKWLYVEQAVSSNMKKPYRQRVYKVFMQDDGRIASAVYELEDPSKYVHAWENTKLFEEISPDSLIEREGCTVFLKKDDKNCYSGSTNENNCKSSMRGASYATSIVSICQQQVVSWDRGWNSENEYVWGAEKAGYIFKRVKSSKLN